MEDLSGCAKWAEEGEHRRGRKRDREVLSQVWCGALEGSVAGEMGTETAAPLSTIGET